MAAASRWQSPRPLACSSWRTLSSALRRAITPGAQRPKQQSGPHTPSRRPPRSGTSGGPPANQPAHPGWPPRPERRLRTGVARTFQDLGLPALPAECATSRMELVGREGHPATTRVRQGSHMRLLVPHGGLSRPFGRAPQILAAAAVGGVPLRFTPANASTSARRLPVLVTAEGDIDQSGAILRFAARLARAASPSDTALTIVTRQPHCAREREIVNFVRPEGYRPGPVGCGALPAAGRGLSLG